MRCVIQNWIETSLTFNWNGNACACWTLSFRTSDMKQHKQQLQKKKHTHAGLLESSLSSSIWAHMSAIEFTERNEVDEWWRRPLKFEWPIQLSMKKVQKFIAKTAKKLATQGDGQKAHKKCCKQNDMAKGHLPLKECRNKTRITCHTATLRAFRAQRAHDHACLCV